MTISRAEVAHVAKLARLELTEDELERIGAQLSNILQYMETMAELDVSAIPPTAQVIPVSNVYRADKARPSLPHGETVANAPREEDGQFRVAPVFE